MRYNVCNVCLAERFRFRGLPAVLILKKGEVVRTIFRRATEGDVATVPLKNFPHSHTSNAIQIRRL